MNQSLELVQELVSELGRGSGCVHLLSKGRELKNVERLVEVGRALTDVDHHGDTSSTTEEELQKVGQFGLPEGDMVLEPVEKMEKRGVGGRRHCGAERGQRLHRRRTDGQMGTEIQTGEKESRQTEG